MCYYLNVQFQGQTVKQGTVLDGHIYFYMILFSKSVILPVSIFFKYREMVLERFTFNVMMKLEAIHTPASSVLRYAWSKSAANKSWHA